MQKRNFLDQHKLLIAFLILLPLVFVAVSRTMVPFALLPDQLGQVIYETLSIAVLIWGVRILAKSKRWWPLALAVTNLYTGMLILVSQWFYMLSCVLRGVNSYPDSPVVHRSTTALGGFSTLLSNRKAAEVTMGVGITSPHVADLHSHRSTTPMFP